jgi:hypothetical protein
MIFIQRGFGLVSRPHGSRDGGGFGCVRLSPINALGRMSVGGRARRGCGGKMVLRSSLTAE